VASASACSCGRDSLPASHSWYFGVNIPGKPREMLSFAGGLSTYMAKCNESAERGYEGFAID
jgi:hypothetical protein